MTPPMSPREKVAWACKTCNSPRAVDPCPKCGTKLTKPADGWEWPETPDVDRIRALAREVGYAIGVHGTQERDLDLIAAPWVEGAVTPFELAQHIAKGMKGHVIGHETQDKPCGRWSCNINLYGWFKLIDLSVMAPAALASSGDHAELARMKAAMSKSNDEICQSLGKALGYPWFKDDQRNFPGATEENGVCVGEHVAESIADEAVSRISALLAENAALRDYGKSAAKEALEYRDRATEAERKLAEAVGHLTRLADWIEHEVGAELPYAEGETDARTFLSKAAGRGKP